MTDRLFNSKMAAKDLVLLSLIILLTAIIFLVDLTTELGFAVGASYITIVLLARYLSTDRLLLVFAVACTALVILGYFLSPSGNEPWKAVANRLISLYAIWATAIFSWYHRKSRRKRELLISELELANKNLEGFSSAVSHDLRNPLQVIEGLADLLLRKHAGSLDTKGQELIHGIKNNCDNANRLINDFIAFSKTSSREIRKNRVDMVELAKTVYSELTPSAGGRDIRFQCLEMPIAYGDKTMLHQVFKNLVANAIKFTRDRETALIEIGGTTAQDENVYYVKDNGTGFEMESADRLFVFFQRLHDPRQFEGTGLGLFIVKSVIEKHGGRVWAKGKPDQGAVFYFALPIEKR
ncbi:MAG: ATP-binding protein [Desulfobulbaceae bacterium]|nr:ATP-binding protein [Desulfobulbaceae bacterium]